MIMLYKSKKV